MSRIRCTATALAVLAAGLVAQDEKEAPATAPAVAAKVAIAEAGVRLAMPKGFERAERFHGFRDIERGSSVMVVTVPGPFAEVTKGLDEAKFRQRGMTLTSTEDLTIAGKKARLVGFSQTVATPEKTEFRKWMLVFGDEKRTTMVTAAFPAVLADELSDELKRCVLSAEPIAAVAADPGFTIEAAGKLKRNDIAAGMGKALVFALRAEGAGKPGEPVFLAMLSFVTDPVTDRRAFALKRLAQAPSKEKLGTIHWTRPIEVDGLSGFEIHADAALVESGAGLALYQVMLFTESGYFLMRGSCPRDDVEEYLPVFRRMALSFRRTKEARPETARK